MAETADVVVVGGGTTGCSIAWHLSRAGLKVHLLEQAAIASGSTGDSPGIVRQYYPDLELATLAADCLRTYLNWHELFGGDCGYKRTGFVTGIAPSQWERTRDLVAAQRAEGVGVELLSVTGMQELIPDLVGEGLAGAVYEPDGGYCAPRDTARCFAEGARRFGAMVEEFRPVRCIDAAGGRVRSVETDAGRIDCPVVINAAGPWATGLAATCGVSLPITATRQCVAIVAIPRDVETPLPGYGERGLGFYLRPDGGGIYMIGSLLASDSYPIDPSNFDRRMDVETIEGFAARAARRFMRLAGAKPGGSRVSFFDETPDGNPVVGADLRVEGLIVVAGLSGHGFKFAPILGQGICELLQTGKMPSALAKFDLARFSL
jgi:sarcosine oxidase, subunit beta